MRYFVITAFLLLNTAFTFGQIVNDGTAFFNYNYNKNLIKKNKVQSITIEMFDSGGKNLGMTIYNFDKDGLLTSQSIKDSSGLLKREYYFSVNSHNDLVSRIQNDYEYNRIDTVTYFKIYVGDKLIKDSSSEIPISYNYEYDKNGFLLKTIISSNYGLGNKTKRVIVNKIDSLGKVINITETVYKNDDKNTATKFSDRNIFYNDKGKVEKEIEKLNSKYSWMANKGSVNYVYDSSGNVLQINRTSAASYSFTYDEKGLITTEKIKIKLEKDDIIDTEIEITTLDKYAYTFRQ